MDFLIVTGMSGSGKTKVYHILEDVGFYCVDNMPTALISRFAELYLETPETKRIAFIVDCRGEKDFSLLFTETERLCSAGHACKFLFLDCSDDVLIHRYKEARRSHPLARDGKTITEALTEERKRLSSVRERADFMIDTSSTTPAQLALKVRSLVTSGEEGILFTCTSFGFKYGIPTDADTVFDVRCFPNPFYVPELKEKTGLDEKVRDYVMDDASTEGFMKRMTDMIDYLIPLYLAEGKTQCNIAIGCTGGRHRSVAIAEALNRHLCEAGHRSVAIHRDIEK